MSAPPHDAPPLSADPNDDLGQRLTGQVLADRYEIGSVLGEGGIGVVFRAMDRQTARPVAIKVLRDLYCVQQSFRRRFAREARALETVRHPHIVAILDSGVGEGSPFLVMELLQGTALSARLRSAGPIPWDQARPRFLELLDGLAFVHESGLMHRDLKPGNVFLECTAEGSERAKLLDFGLAKFLTRDAGAPEATLTKEGQLCGTPGYMAPEQVLGQPTDARADVYTAVLVLFEMLAGRRPFRGKIPQIARQQLSGIVPGIEEVQPGLRAAPELRRLFEKGLRAEPAQRYQSVAELRAAFEALPEAAVQGEAQPGAPGGMAYAETRPMGAAVGEAPTRPMPVLSSRAPRRLSVLGWVVLVTLLVAAGAGLAAFLLPPTP